MHVAALHTQINAIRVEAVTDVEARRGSWRATRIWAPTRNAIGARRQQPRQLAVVWPLLARAARATNGAPKQIPIGARRPVVWKWLARAARATSGTGCRSPRNRASQAQARTRRTRVRDRRATAPATLAARATRAAAGRAAPLRNRAEGCKVQAASGTGRRSPRNRGWESKGGGLACRRGGGNNEARATKAAAAGIQFHRKRVPPPMRMGGTGGGAREQLAPLGGAARGRRKARALRRGQRGPRRGAGWCSSHRTGGANKTSERNVRA